MATETPCHELFASVRETASALSALEDAFTARTAKLAEDRRTLEVELDAMRIEVAEEREAVARDRAGLEADLARIRAVQPLTDERIKLNVGGVRYETSRATLTNVPESMLATMFGGRADMLQRDPDDGSVFIDRDGERFWLILDYMRDRDAPRVAGVIQELSEARQEAMVQELVFFGLKDVVFPPRLWFEEAAFAVGLGAAKMDQQRRFCGAVLHGRRAVVFGGQSSYGDYVASTEVLDLDTMTFGQGPHMSTERSGCAAVVLDARRALVLGGFNRYGCLTTTEILDLETMVFSAGPEMRTLRRGCAAVALDARRILVAGGSHGSSLETTEILDLGTMTFAPGPMMVSRRCGCAAVALDAHRVLIVGGRDANSALETTEVLDVRTMAFSPGPSMRSKRRYCAAFPLDSRHRLVISGRDENLLRMKSTEILDIETMEFRDGPKMNEARFGPGAVVDEERVLVFGGSCASMTTSEILISVAPEEEGLRRRRR